MPDATSHHAALLAKLSDNEDYWLLFGALRVVLDVCDGYDEPERLTPAEARQEQIAQGVRRMLDEAMVKYEALINDQQGPEGVA